MTTGSMKYAGQSPDETRPAMVASVTDVDTRESTALKFYTDRRYLPPDLPHCSMLIPLWGDTHDHDGYSQFAREGSEFLRLAPIEEAEIALLPFDGQYLIHHHPEGPNPEAIRRARQLVAEASAANLKTLVIVNSDQEAPVPLDNVIVLRTSLNRRTRRAYEFALPAWHEDLATRLGGRLTIREKRARPSVGFCGHAATSGPRPRRRAKMVARQLLRPLGIHIAQNDGIYLRRDAMAALSRSPDVDTDFIVRSYYFGGAMGKEKLASHAEVRKAYLDNLVGNDYALNVRGYGNYSFRFFETMSVGRVPLLIDTECVLPYDFLHDYRDLCVLVADHRIHRISEYLTDFHRRFSDDEFRDLQRRLRQFWLDWLSPQGFFRNVARHWDPRPPARPQVDAGDGVKRGPE